VCLLSTSSLIGEGFDLPELDTLVITMPLSFKGRLVQYAGRLHRVSDGKKDVLIHDYVDSSCAMTLNMYHNRLRVYANMGYKVEAPTGLFGLV
jgi:superfamily II DNA or RNA helicase